MSNVYCDFNVKLFKPFTSMKKKIQPALSDDWEMVPDTYNTKGGFSLRSKKLNQQVADIDLRRFLQFSKEFDLVIKGLKLQGEFIVGSDRSVYTKEHFEEYNKRYNERINEGNFIPKKDLIIGHRYLTPCGAEFVYAGARYKTSFKTDHMGKTCKFSKPKRVHTYISKRYDGKNFLEEIPSKYKFTKDLGVDKLASFIENATFTNCGRTDVFFRKEKSDTVSFKELVIDSSMVRNYSARSFGMIEKNIFVKIGSDIFCFTNLKTNGYVSDETLKIDGTTYYYNKNYKYRLILDDYIEMSEESMKSLEPLLSYSKE